jgi:hypothetical protein
MLPLAFAWRFAAVAVAAIKQHSYGDALADARHHDG